MRKGQPVNVNGRTFQSLKEAAESAGCASNTAHYRAMGVTAKPTDGSKWELHGRRVYRDKVRVATVKVVFKGMMYDSYVHAAYCNDLSPSTIRRYVVEGIGKNCYLLDSSCWRRVDPDTGAYVK